MKKKFIPPHAPHFLIASFLALLVLAVFFPVRNFEFLHYDDNLYITQNPYLQNGFGWQGLRWAFSADLFHESPYVDYWQPMTAVSRMIEIGCLGFNAGSHHWVNLFLHTLNVLLLFALLRVTTGYVWRSFWVAAFFAVHPLQAEPVAWLMGRKDLLSVFFCLSALHVYSRFVKSGKVFFLAGSVMLYLLGLMSKPAIVGLPVVLFFWDRWPLGLEPKQESARRFLFAKLPYVLFSGIFCVIPLIAQRCSLYDSPDLFILARIPLAYLGYLMKIFFPVGLGLRPPLGIAPVSAAQIIPAIFILSVLSSAVFVQRRRFPFLFLGWCWYLAFLVPAVGLSTESDRFLYLPAAGVFIMVVWGISEIKHGGKDGVFFKKLLAVALLFSSSVLCFSQLGYWKDSISVFRRALELDGRNFIVRNNYGLLLLERGEAEEAFSEFREALRINPRYGITYHNIGLVLAYHLGKPEEAIRYFLKAIELDPLLVQSHYSLANILAKEGRPDDAVHYFRKAVQTNPNYRATISPVLARFLREEIGPTTNTNGMFAAEWKD